MTLGRTAYLRLKLCLVILADLFRFAAAFDLRVVPAMTFFSVHTRHHVPLGTGTSCRLIYSTYFTSEFAWAEFVHSDCSALDEYTCLNERLDGITNGTLRQRALLCDNFLADSDTPTLFTDV